MTLKFCGACREVTGSCHLAETDETKLLVDCGMFQGCDLCDIKNYVAWPFDPSKIEAVIVTHAHLDHVGRLPKLVKNGFAGKIYATPPSIELARIVLEDACRIMQEDEKRTGRPPLYDERDLEECLRHFEPQDYGRSFKIGGFEVKLHDAGHIFGSAFVELRTDDGASAVFSGDLGNKTHILRETARLPEARVLVIESTYGNRDHENESERSCKLRAAIAQTAQKGGALVIPAFAIERTQQLLYEMNELVEQGLVPKIDVYLDSPMAIRATRVMRSYPEYYDHEALSLASMGDDFFDFPGLRLTDTREESKSINDAPFPKIIIAGSGMMNGGRILHHLRRYLPDQNSTVLIIGYQAQGTLGRKLYEGNRLVEVFGDRVPVKAKVTAIGAYSAHADRNKLMNWVQNAVSHPQKIFCVHGDEEASLALASTFGSAGYKAEAPHIYQTTTLPQPFYVSLDSHHRTPA